MTMNMKFNVGKALRRLDVTTRSGQDLIRKSVRGTVDDLGSEIKRRGGSDIRRGGKFSQRWVSAFEAEPRHQGDRSGLTVGFNRISSTIPSEAGLVHEFGATIRGRPLLWIPLPWLPELKGVRARDFPGRLFRVERPGKNPLLFSADDRRPKYVGVTHVVLGSRFHIRGITANTARTQLARMFFEHLRRG